MGKRGPKPRPWVINPKTGRKNKRKSKRKMNLSPEQREALRKRALEVMLPARRAKYGRTGGYGRKMGCPDGMSQKEYLEIMAKAEEKAERAIEGLDAQGLLDMSQVPEGEEAQAKEALKYATAVVLARADSTPNRLKAADIVLRYTKGTKNKSDVSLEGAEALLAAALAHGSKPST